MLRTLAAMAASGLASIVLVNPLANALRPLTGVNFAVHAIVGAPLIVAAVAALAVLLVAPRRL